MLNTFLKSGPHKHLPMLGFIPGDILPGLFFFFSVLLLFSFSGPQLCLQWVKRGSVGFGPGDWLDHGKTFLFFALKSLSSLLKSYFGSLSVSTVKLHPVGLNVSGSLRPAQFRIPPVAFLSSQINKNKWTRFPGRRAHPRSKTRWSDSDRQQLLPSSILFSLLHSDTIFVSYLRMLFQSCSSLLDVLFCFLSTDFNLILVFLRLTNGLNLVENPLHVFTCGLGHRFAHLPERASLIRPTGVFFPWSSRSLGVCSWAHQCLRSF